MSVSDPLIKDMKGYVLKFLEDLKETGSIYDSNANLSSFSQTIETIFNKGLLSQHNALSFFKQNDAWTWMEKLGSIRHSSITFGYTSSVENVKRCANLLTNTGKFRLLLRHCLVYKCLHIPIKYLINTEKVSALYKANSVLGDEILAEIFLSVLLQCSEIAFHLDLSNTSFLDLTWMLPEMLKLELVPCKTLGLSVSFANEKAVIISMTPNSVISENGKIQVGDVLDNLNGTHISSASKGKLSSVLRSSKGQPVTLAVIKAKSSNSNELYPPIVNLLKQVKIDPDALRNKSGMENSELEEQSLNKSSSPGFKTTYIGFVKIGNRGDVKQIDKSVKTLLTLYNRFGQDSTEKYKRLKKAVCFEVGEIGIKIVEPDSLDVMLKHSYMEISSCGSVSNMPHYFAYIAGDQYCNVAKNFTCYVFYSKCYDTVHTILQSIGQGFHRTHFAV